VPSRLPPNHERLPFDAARRQLVADLPRAEIGEEVSPEDLDREVEQFLRIGLYAADRWAAEHDASGEPWFARQRRQDALDNFTQGQRRVIEADTRKLLDAYLDRKRPVLDRELLWTQIEALRANLRQDIVSALPPRKHHRRPEWLRWFIAEFGAGPVAALGVIVVALIIHVLDPALGRRAGHELEGLFGVAPVESPASSSHATTPAVAK
jgi:hypothetical protein